MISDRWRFLINRIRERLWIKPLLVCLLSILVIIIAKAADHTQLQEVVPTINTGSIETLLSIMASSMLVIATFAVGSMVAAYASASNSATPRTFSLVVSDDVSQNALSSFIAAFISSTIALVALQNNYFGIAGRFVIFVLTLGVFALIIFTFVHWVDRIARLGRLTTTIDKVESAVAQSLQRRRQAPHLHGVSGEDHAARLSSARDRGADVHTIFSRQVGYVQRIDMSELQSCAESADVQVMVEALPGTFVAPGRPLVVVWSDSGPEVEVDEECIKEAFLIGGDRLYDEDPRFGLIVLSEIACRALSPAVNDPGTAIDIIGTLVRLFTEWASPRNANAEEQDEPKYARVAVPALSEHDMFDDAFAALARDGAGAIEICVRLQKAFGSLAAVGHEGLREAAKRHASLALSRAELALQLDYEVETVRRLAQFAHDAPSSSEH